MTPYQSEVMKIIEKLNNAYKDELQDYLVSLYHKLLCDNLTLDDIIDIGEIHGLDIEDEYEQRVKTLEDLEDEDGTF